MVMTLVTLPAAVSDSLLDSDAGDVYVETDYMIQDLLILGC